MARNNHLFSIALVCLLFHLAEIVSALLSVSVTTAEYLGIKKAEIWVEVSITIHLRELIDLNGFVTFLQSNFFFFFSLSNSSLPNSKNSSS